MPSRQDVLAQIPLVALGAALVAPRVLDKVPLGQSPKDLCAGCRTVLLLARGGIDSVGNVATHRVRAGTRGSQSNGRVLPNGRAARATSRSVTKTKCPTLDAVGRDPQGEPGASHV